MVLFFVVLFLGCFFTANSASADLTDSSLKAFWKLNEGSGDRLDSSGNNRSLSPSVGGAGIATGRFRNAASFATTSSQYLSIADNDDLSAGDVDFTIAGWFYLATETTYNDLVSKWSGSNREYLLFYNSSAERFDFTVTSNGASATAVNVTAENLGLPSTGTWYFIVAWHDHAADTINIQAGIANANGTGTLGIGDSTPFNAGVFSGTADFLIGSRAIGGPYYLNGRADAVGFWKKVLSDDEKNQLYNGGVGMEIPVSAVTSYVNGTGSLYVGTQGTYGVGSDTTGDGTRDKPYATFARAESAGVDGDTVYVAAGTYVENPDLAVSKAITWIADGAVTVQSLSTSAVLELSGSKATSFNGFTFDGQDLMSALVYLNGANNKTFTNCTLKDPTGTLILAIGTGGGNNNVINSAGGGSCNLTVASGTLLNSAVTMGITISGCTIEAKELLNYASSDASNQINIIDNEGSNSITVTNNAINFAGSGILNFSRNKVIQQGAPDRFFSGPDTGKTGTLTFEDNDIDSSVPFIAPFIELVNAAPYTISIKRNDINISATDHPVKQQPIIKLANQINPDIESNTFTIEADGGPYAIDVGECATSCGTVQIKNNIIRTKSQTAYGITVGNEGPTDYDGTVNGAVITGNTIYGPYYYDPTLGALPIHGIHWGFSVNGVMANNIIIGMAYGFAIEGNPTNAKPLAPAQVFTSGGVYNNLIIDCLGQGGIYGGGFNPIPIYNNTVYTDRSTSDTAYGIAYGNSRFTGTAIAKNNIVSLTDAHNLIRIGQGGDDILTSDYNLFWNTAGSGMDFEIINNPNPDDLTADFHSLYDWQHAVGYSFDSNSISSDPLFTNTTRYLYNPADPNNYPDISNDFALQYTSPAIDVGTTSIASRTTDILGNHIYGTPDIGAYEYQPPHDIDTDKINKDAGARIYGDSKFRDVGTTGADTVSLKITPSGGTWTSYGATDTRPAWLDVSNIDYWTNDHKKWKESNASASDLVTDHTVGDLDASKYYKITVSEVDATAKITGINGTACNTVSGNRICKSNGSGVIAFQYTGGYSDHTFEMTEDDNTAPILSGGSIIGTTTDTTPEFTFTSDEAGTATFGGDCSTTPAVASIIAGSNTITFSTPLSAGIHSNCTVIVTDATGNASDALAVGSFTITSADNGVEDLDISDVDYSSNKNSITIKWKTNNDADSRVKYGTSKSNLDKEKKENDNETKHKIVLKGLDPNTQYYFKIYSEDENGDKESTNTYKIMTDKEVNLHSYVSSLFPNRQYQPVENIKKDNGASEEKKSLIDNVGEKIDEKVNEIKQKAEKTFFANIFNENNQALLSEVKFKIVNKNNEPISNLPITLFSDPQEAITDGNGIATFKDVPTGSHTLSFAYNNENFNKKVAISEPQTETGIVQAEIITIKAEKDPIPVWIWGIIAVMGVIILLLIFKKKLIFGIKKGNTS